jgi:hypothetical protein
MDRAHVSMQPRGAGGTCSCIHDSTRESCCNNSPTIAHVVVELGPPPVSPNTAFFGHFFIPFFNPGQVAGRLAIANSALLWSRDFTLPGTGCQILPWSSH